MFVSYNDWFIASLIFKKTFNQYDQDSLRVGRGIYLTISGVHLSDATHLE